MSDELFKVVIIGDSGVGKSNLMTRYTQNEFSADTPSTIGVEFMTKTVKIDSREVKVQIWDTAGQERFRAISRSIYHGAKGAMLVYDITNQTSFDNLSMWLQELRVHVPASAVIVLVGNKCDLEHMRAVKTETASRFARDHGMSFMETSALEMVNVDKAFEFLVRAMHEMSMNGGGGGSDATKPRPKAVAPAAVKLTAPPAAGGSGGAAGGGKCQC